MPYKLFIEPDTDIVHLIYSGTVLIEERMAARDEVFSHCQDGIHYRVLVDMSHSDIKMTMDDAINFSKAFEKANLPENYRLACIVSEANAVERIVQTLISIEKINVKYFMEEKQAVRWLLAK